MVIRLGSESPWRTSHSGLISKNRRSVCANLGFIGLPACRQFIPSQPAPRSAKLKKSAGIFGRIFRRYHLMSCNDWRPDSGMKRVASAWLVAAAMFAWAQTAYAAAPTNKTGIPIPKDYIAEQVGLVQWVFPASASAEARALQKLLPSAWNQVNYEVGANPGELTVRIGLNPQQMQKLAPPNVRIPAYATGLAIPSEGLILLTLTSPESW